MLIRTQGIDQQLSVCSKHLSQRRAKPLSLPPKLTAKFHIPVGVSERDVQQVNICPLSTEQAQTYTALIMLDFKWKRKG